jgi:hypothetical protein
MALYAALERNPNINSFEELFEQLQRLKLSERRDATELIATANALRRYRPLLVPRDADERQSKSTIQMSRVIEESQVVYYWLPAALESASVREVGKLALYSLLQAAIDRKQSGAEPKQIYLFIDEFQRIAAENFKVILEQARSFKIGAILANQTRTSLRTPDADLRSTVSANTRVKMYFSATDPLEQANLVATSGEEIGVLQDFGFSMIGDTQGRNLGFKESLKPRLTANDVIRISDHPLDFILHVSRGSGYTQFGGLPVAVRTSWPIDYQTYCERQNEPWPTLEECAPDELVINTDSPQEIENDAFVETHQLFDRELKKVLADYK